MRKPRSQILTLMVAVAAVAGSLWSLSSPTAYPIWILFGPALGAVVHRRLGGSGIAGGAAVGVIGVLAAPMALKISARGPESMFGIAELISLLIMGGVGGAYGGLVGLAVWSVAGKGAEGRALLVPLVARYFPQRSESD